MKEPSMPEIWFQLKRQSSDGSALNTIGPAGQIKDIPGDMMVVNLCQYLAGKTQIHSDLGPVGYLQLQAIGIQRDRERAVLSQDVRLDELVTSFNDPLTVILPALPGDRFYSDSDVLGLIPIGFKPSPKETSTKGTHMSRWAVTPTGNLRLWDDFLDGVAAHEVSNTPRHTETTFAHLKALLSDKPDVSDEKTLEGALSDHVYKVLKRIAEPREKFGSHSAVGGVLGEPDCVMYVEPGDPHVQANADSLHLVIEVKLPSVLPVDDLVNKYNQDTLEFSQDHVVHDSVIHQVEQVFGYLSHNRLQYGVLTTYTNTWFLRREGGTLYVSPVVHYNDNNPTLLQCYAYTISLARQADPMEPAPATPDNLDDDNDTHNDIKVLSTGFTVSIGRANLNNFIRRGVLGCGRSGSVFLAKWRGDEVAMKVCDLYQHPDYEEEVLTEVAVYDALKSLQGDCIPRFKFAGYDGGFFVIATEVAGRPLSDIPKPGYSICMDTIRALSKIHKLGILHNDIRLENILFNPHKGKVCFIDFALSRRVRRKSEFKKEMNQLFSLLGLPPKPLSITNTSQLKLPPNTNVSQPKLLPSMNTWSKLPPSMNTRSKLQSIVNSPQSKLLSNGATFRLLAFCKNIPTRQNLTRKNHFNRVQKRPRTMNLRTRTVSVPKFR